MLRIAVTRAEAIPPCDSLLGAETWHASCDRRFPRARSATEVQGATVAYVAVNPGSESRHLFGATGGADQRATLTESCCRMRPCPAERAARRCCPAATTLAVVPGVAFGTALAWNSRVIRFASGRSSTHSPALTGWGLRDVVISYTISGAMCIHSVFRGTAGSGEVRRFAALAVVPSATDRTGQGSGSAECFQCIEQLSGTCAPVSGHVGVRVGSLHLERQYRNRTAAWRPAGGTERSECHGEA